MSKLRFKALEDACSHKPVAVATPTERPSVFFGKMVFTREKMKEYIADTILDQLFDVIDNGKPLSRDIANSVAMGMKKWASEFHYALLCHRKFFKTNGKTKCNLEFKKELFSILMHFPIG